MTYSKDPYETTRMTHGKFYGKKGQFTMGQTARWSTAVPFWRSNLLLLRHLAAREVGIQKLRVVATTGAHFFWGGVGSIYI